MTVTVVPLPCALDELKFDIILPEGHVKTVSLDMYALRTYRGASIADIVEHEVKNLLEDMQLPDTSLKIIYR